MEPQKNVPVVEASVTFDDHRDMLLASQERQLEVVMYENTIMRDALRNIQADSTEEHIRAQARDGLLGIR